MHERELEDIRERDLRYALPRRGALKNRFVRASNTNQTSATPAKTIALRVRTDGPDGRFGWIGGFDLGVDMMRLRHKGTFTLDHTLPLSGQPRKSAATRRKTIFPEGQNTDGGR